MSDLLYTGMNMGQYRYFDPVANKYSFSDTKPSQEDLDKANASMTYKGTDPATGLVSYSVDGTDKTMFTDTKLPVSLPPVIANSSPASAPEVVKEVEQVPGWKDVPGVPGARTLTVQSDGLFTTPPVASAAVASVSQKSSELLRAVGGQGAMSTVTPQNAGSKLIKPNKTTEDFMMKLTSKQTGDQIIFNVTPTIDESRSANYEHIAPVHHPGTIQVYKNTESRQFNIGVKLISRTAQEATDNITYLNWIRSWVMPYYGQGTADNTDSDRLGAPPDILIFDVYGDQNISNIPVVLTSYHWVYPDTCDYIPTLDGTPFPTIMDISLALVESYSPEQYSNFDITSYRTGDMLGAYTFSSTPN